MPEVTRLDDHREPNRGRASLPAAPTAAEVLSPASARFAAAEAVAAAAYKLLSQYATWGLLQGGAIAAELPLAERMAQVWSSAGGMLENDPGSALEAYRALEEIDAAVDDWTRAAMQGENAGATS